MYKRLACVLLAVFSLNGCFAYKMGDVLPPAGDVKNQVKGETIALKVVTNDSWSSDKRLASKVPSLAKNVFNQYGFHVVENGQAPISAEILFTEDSYSHAWFSLLCAATALALVPAKNDHYTQLDVKFFVNGSEQGHAAYIGNFTEYITMYGPGALLVPGITQYGEEGNQAIKIESFRRTLQHVAKDVKARYFSSNYQNPGI